MNKRLFVYGSLKIGFYNNYLLSNSILENRKVMLPAFAMYLIGNYPGIIENTKYNVYGESYFVNKKILVELDKLENAYNFFRKELYVKINSVYDKAWVYVYHGKFNKDLLVKSGKLTKYTINQFFE